MLASICTQTLCKSLAQVTYNNTISYTASSLALDPKSHERYLTMFYYPHHTSATPSPQQMFKSNRSESPNKPLVAPTPTIELDYETKRDNISAKLDRVLLQISLHEGKLVQLKALASTGLRNGKTPETQLEQKILFTRNTIFSVQQEYQEAVQVMRAWEERKHQKPGNDSEARVETNLENAGRKLETLQYGDLIMDTDA